MNSEVFGPLGMSNTTFSNEEVLERGKWGAGTDPSGEITPQSYDNVWAAPAGYALDHCHGCRAAWTVLAQWG